MASSKIYPGYMYVSCTVLYNSAFHFQSMLLQKTQMEEYRVRDAYCWVIVDGSHRSELCSCVVKPNV